MTTDDPIERCMMCFCDFPISELVTHAVKCQGEMLGSKDRFRDFLPSIHDVCYIHYIILIIIVYTRWMH